MAIGKRLRFEILKRDGFRCKCCGATPAQRELRVDHIVPRANGGTDDPANLIAACFACNAGKSDKELHESPDAIRTPASEIKTRLAGAQAMLEAQRDLERVRSDLIDEFEAMWSEAVGYSMPITVKRALRNIVDDIRGSPHHRRHELRSVLLRRAEERTDATRDA